METNAWEFLAEQVALHLQPAGRANATAGTLRQIGSWLDGLGFWVLTGPQLRAAFDRISEGYAELGDLSPAISARAATVREMAALLPPPSASAGEAQEIWEYLGERFPGEDPRSRAIRETWSREARWL